MPPRSTLLAAPMRIANSRAGFPATAAPTTSCAAAPSELDRNPLGGTDGNGRSPCFYRKNTGAGPLPTPPSDLAKNQNARIVYPSFERAYYSNCCNYCQCYIARFRRGGAPAAVLNRVTHGFWG